MDPVDADLNAYHNLMEHLDELSEEWQAEVDEEVERRARAIDVMRWTRQDADAYLAATDKHEEWHEDGTLLRLLERLLREILAHREPVACWTDTERIDALYEGVTRALRECARTWITYAVEDETPRPET